MQVSGPVRQSASLFQKLTGRETVYLKDITTDVIERYNTARSKEPVSRNGHTNSRKTLGACKKTVSEEMRRLKALLAHAVKREWLQRMPIFPDFPTLDDDDASAHRPFSEEEIPRFLDAAKEYDQTYARGNAYPTWFHDCFSAYIYAGLRKEELHHLEWSDVDFKEGTISIGSKTIQSIRRIQLDAQKQPEFEKLIRKESIGALLPNSEPTIKRACSLLHLRNRKPLLLLRQKDYDREGGIISLREEFEWKPKATAGKVPIHSRLKVILNALHTKKCSNFVFPSPQGDMWHLDIRDHMIRIAKMADIHDFIRVHDLRHTTGAMLRRKNIGLETIKEILRHKNLEETLVYARYEINEGRKAIEKLPDWG